jgi:transcriptional regulator
MTDALISDLARVRALRVISRTSVMRYRGSRRSLPEIARELNVQAVVEGSVLHAGDRVRITVQLIDAARDLHLWAESYEGELRNVLKLQAEVARAITREIQVVVTPQEQAVLGKSVTVNPEAHQDYLLGRFHWNKRTPDALRRGLEFFERALTKDAGYAPAYSGIADTHLILSLATYDLVPPAEAVPQARAAALRALEIDDTLAEARVSLANIKARFEWDWAGADGEFQRALELNPNYAYAYHCFASHEAALGRFGEALAHQERAMELDPFSIVVGMGRARLFYFARQYERARAQCRSTLEMEPRFWVAYLLTGLCQLREGVPDEAVESLERACSLGEGLTLPLAARAPPMPSRARKTAPRRDRAAPRDESRALRPRLPDRRHPFEPRKPRRGLRVARTSVWRALRDDDLARRRTVLGSPAPGSPTGGPSSASRAAGVSASPRLVLASDACLIWHPQRSVIVSPLRMQEEREEVLKGTLDLMVLKTLAALGPLHGYGISRRIEQLSDDLLRLNEGTVYASLLRLGQRGWIRSEWGSSDNNRRAKFYSITAAGRRQLARETESWERVAGVVARVLRLRKAE